ncbi:MAG: hypothetical protein AAGK92_10805 [Pseudomonadota bacterium]
MSDHPPAAALPLGDTRCDAFETQLLPIARLLVASLNLSDPTLWHRATREAVDIWGDAIGYPVAHALGRVVITVHECRASKLGFGLPEGRGQVTDDERHFLRMLHHMRRDNANEARSAVEDLTQGLMAPDVIRAGLSFAHRFACGLERRRRTAPPVLSVVT